MVLIALSLVIGIIISDGLFYENNEIPMWLDVATWGFCALVTFVAWAVWRKEFRKGLGRWLFPLLAFLFFVAIGFIRYASYARDMHEVWAKMERPPVNRGNPDEFDYVRWRWVQGVEDSTSLLSGVKSYALRLRSRLVEGLGAAEMDDQAAAIVVAATLGDRSQLSTATRDLYAAAGASHLLALSGLHLSIIVGFFIMLMNGPLIMSRWRPVIFIAVIVFIWGYAFVAGLPTSLVRAALMTTFFLCGSMARRNSGLLHWLTLTAVLMLLVRPVVLFDVGAQLSFAAVAGILILWTHWQQWAYTQWRLQIYRLERWHLVWPLRLVSVSLAAQIATLPLVMYYFHQIPLYAPLFNIVFIPLTTIMIYFALAMFLIALVPFCQPLLPLMGRVLSWIVAAQLSVMSFEVKLPGAVIKDFWSRKAEPQVVIYNNWRCPALHVIAGPSRSWLLMPEPDSMQTGMYYIASTFWRRRLTAEPQLLKDQKSVEIGDFQAVMIDGEVCASSEPVQVDVLWLTKGFKYKDIDSLMEMYSPWLLVLDSSLPQWQREMIRDKASREGWSVYDVSEEGALRLKYNW